MITLSASGSSYNAPASTVPCWLYVAVRNDGSTNASCSVMLQQRSSTPATLVDGQPQAGTVSRNGMRLYQVSNVRRGRHAQCGVLLHSQRCDLVCILSVLLR